jgi:hypothetical protein
LSALSSKFAAALQERFHPRPYQQLAKPPPGCALLMVQWHLAGGRYALGVFDWHSTVDGASQLQRAREQVAQTLWAMPVIGEVGLYAIFCGTCD